ncbi:BgTH12-00303 [Blumeria graminis f. sp. triticale]|uniref:Oxidoreductase n=4 Tax=Blumeria graminis TaxID=34373 RepID=A0A656KG46_BLUGR|nr:oxidoreductase [Blumeria graminis f. sp. tritici 96224]CAD6504800.1 BgTH12-00303 [Blumeria graminis f. sp. triticale]VDB92824.1 Bgt-2821 [Blumeria graminis f. sp. tritici]
MAIHIIAEALSKGIPGISNKWKILWFALCFTLIGIVKWFSTGISNTSERKLHGKIIMITGGTSGIGAAAVLSLAQRGAQIILLVHQPPNDLFLIDFIGDLREKSGNELIYAEQVDLSSLYSIRKFATKWIDNAPPRRLDMIILCAATLTPPGKQRTLTEEGLEEMWMVNYLCNYHLLSILSPAIRAQPPDRDVRIIFTTCSSYSSSPPIKDYPTFLKNWAPSKSYAQSKLALTIFAQSFQKHLSAYQRPDGAPMNARVIIVNPGYTRTPGMRRWLSRGTFWGLGMYIVLWEFAWLFLKCSEDGAQSLLYAAMEASLSRGPGGKFIKECKEVKPERSELTDDAAGKKLWEGSEILVEATEKKILAKQSSKKKMKKKEIDSMKGFCST